MEPLPRRKPTRLKGYDYSKNGAYFLTLCARDKAHLFGRLAGTGVPDAPAAVLSPFGEIVRNRLEEMNRVYPDLRVEHYVIMPNHIHLLLTLFSPSGSSGTPTPTGAEGTPAPANARIPRFVSTLKRMTNRAAGTELWQRSFHDHVIRDDADYAAHWTYIDGNPSRWTEDEYYVE